MYSVLVLYLLIMSFFGLMVGYAVIPKEVRASFGYDFLMFFYMGLSFMVVTYASGYIEGVKDGKTKSNNLKAKSQV